MDQIAAIVMVNSNTSGSKCNRVVQSIAPIQAPKSNPMGKELPGRRKASDALPNQISMITGQINRRISTADPRA